MAWKEKKQMANLNFYQNRLNGAIAKVEKLEKKVAKLEKIFAETNDKYDEFDVECAKKDLERAKESMKKYADQVAKETEKASSRNVPAILEFLNNWETKVVAYFLRQRKGYEEALKEYYEEGRKYCEWFNHGRCGMTIEEIKARKEEHYEYEREFRREWAHVTQFDRGESWEATMRKAVANEKEAKYDDIIERANKVVGKITDASKLSVGAKGELNGIVIGTRGTAKIETIGAGGYNIQCFHFRTLIHEVKGA